jgi:tetratricopeptide (TPR) repeat protein
VVVWGVLVTWVLPLASEQELSAKWQSYFAKAQEAVEEDRFDQAVEHYEFGLKEREKIPLAIRVDADIALATLLVDGAKSMIGDPIDRAEDLYVEALELSKNVPELHLIVRNSFGVFLLKLSSYSRARDIFYEVVTEARSLRIDNSELAVFMYNYGQALEHNDEFGEALSAYLSSYEADPLFQPAAESVWRLALLADPSSGIRAGNSLVARALENLNLSDANDYLVRILSNSDWCADDNLGETMVLLARFFEVTSLPLGEFRERWEASLDTLRKEAPRQVALKAEAILDAYSSRISQCLGPDDLRRRYPLWSLSDFQIFSEFMSALADEAVQQGDGADALAKYLLAACFDPLNESNNFHLANFLLEDQVEFARFKEMRRTISPELHAAVGSGFETMGMNDLALNAYLAAAHASDSPPSIAKYMEKVFKVASYDQRANIIDLKDILLVKAREDEEPVHAYEKQASGVTFAVAKFGSVPNSRGSLSLVSLVASSTLQNHLSVADNEGGKAPVATGEDPQPRNENIVTDDLVTAKFSELDAAPFYYAIDALEAINIVAESNDTMREVSGPLINLVTKRPAGHWAASASYTFLPDELQGDGSAKMLSEGLVEEPNLTARNRIRESEEVGAQAGGPIFKNKSSPMVWASHNESTLSTTVLGGALFTDKVKNSALKVVPWSSGSSMFLLSLSKAKLEDSGVGAGILRRPDATSTQVGRSEDWRAEFRKKLTAAEFLVRYSRAVGDLEQGLVPEGSLGAMSLDADGVWHGDSRHGESSYTADFLELSGSMPDQSEKIWRNSRFGVKVMDARNFLFVSTGSLNASYINRRNAGGDVDIARFYRSGSMRSDLSEYALWGSGAVTAKRLSLDIGLRYEIQNGSARQGVVVANPIVPNLLPGTSVPAMDRVVDWKSWSPRVGISYLSKKDIAVQVGYARFYSPLRASYVQRVSALSPGYIEYGFQDENGNDFLDQNELASLAFLTASGVDPLNTAGVSPNLNDSDLKPETTDELSLGIDKKLAGGLEVRLSSAFRRTRDVLELRRLIRDNSGETRLARRDDYALDGLRGVLLPDGSRSMVSLFSLKPGLSPTGGSLLTNGDRWQDYFDVRLELAKEVSDGGRLRALFAYQSSEWGIGPQFSAFDDPTSAAQSTASSGVSTADQDGDIVVRQLLGLERPRDVNLGGEWSFGLNGSVRIPYGARLGANINYRSGGPLPYYITVIADDGIERNIRAVGRADSFRLPDFWLVDVRLEKTVEVRDSSITLSIECFNLLNESAALQRNLQLNGPQPDFLAKTLNARAIRVGLQLGVDRKD